MLPQPAQKASRSPVRSRATRSLAIYMMVRIPINLNLKMVGSRPGRGSVTRKLRHSTYKHLPGAEPRYVQSPTNRMGVRGNPAHGGDARSTALDPSGTATNRDGAFAYGARAPAIHFSPRLGTHVISRCQRSSPPRAPAPRVLGEHNAVLKTSKYGILLARTYMALSGIS